MKNLLNTQFDDLHVSLGLQFRGCEKIDAATLTVSVRSTVWGEILESLATQR